MAADELPLICRVRANLVFSDAPVSACVVIQVMKVCIRRDSVAAGDDADAPHGQTLEMPEL